MAPVSNGDLREVSPGSGEWENGARFTGEEVYFEDHFPGYPIVPGVLLLEAMRETAQAAVEKGGHPVRLVEASRLRLIRPCMPPAEVKVLVRVDPKQDLAARCEVVGADGKKFATVRVQFERVEE
jgi:3-hydroxyacyl-[acyl-carrier-protein] dehydratase